MMKRLILLVLLFCTVSLARAGVSTRVCLADGNTPLEYYDIMVGTKLTIILSSDAVEDYLYFDVAIQRTDSNRGELIGASLLEGAGEDALLYPVHDDYLELDGFGYSGGGSIGDWFVVDYNAMAIGDCNVWFYENFAMEPNEELSFTFTNVRTRDFDKNTKVDFGDFAMLASFWQEITCEDPNWCKGTDLDTSGIVDINDLMLFTDYWLERTE